LAWALFWQARALDYSDQQLTRRLTADALELFRETDDPLGICWCLNITGSFASNDGRWTEAEALLHESLELARATGADHAVGDTLSELGWLAGRRGDHPRAVELTTEAVAHYRRIHDRYQLGIVLREFALALDAAGDHKGAANTLCEALDLVEEHGFDEQLEWLLRHIALLLPDELDEVSKRLWSRPPDGWTNTLWPQPRLYDKAETFTAECTDRRSSAPANSEPQSRWRDRHWLASAVDRDERTRRPSRQNLTQDAGRPT
jgi:tetratricopeptide (TPR) repeat protein